MIKIQGLTKRFENVTAVDNLTLSIKEGTIWGFVGPNGSGKTTTLRMLATLLSPDEGTAEISGFDIRLNSSEVRARIGFMPDFFGVYDALKVWEYLAFYANAYGLDVKTGEKRSDELLELVELKHKKYDYVDVLSRGMKQRLGLARALIHDPDVMLLDEPASGLDPRARVELREILKKLKTLGKTVIISSHILPELAEMCNEIGIMQGGRLLAQGTVAEITQKMNFSSEVSIRLLTDRDTLNVVDILKKLEISQAKVDGLTVKFDTSNKPEEMARLLEILIKEDVKVVEFKESKHDLEDVFMKVTKEVE